jgi:hypothetical protein
LQADADTACCLVRFHTDTAIAINRASLDDESVLGNIGQSMGSGGFIIVSENNSIKTANRDAAKASAYNSADLDYFHNIVQSVVRDIEEKGSKCPTREDSQSIELQVVTALFEIAKTGERDFAWLKQQVFAALDAKRRPN